jgi:hypothetical protein
MIVPITIERPNGMRNENEISESKSPKIIRAKLKQKAEVQAIRSMIYEYERNLYSEEDHKKIENAQFLYNNFSNEIVEELLIQSDDEMDSPKSKF